MAVPAVRIQKGYARPKHGWCRKCLDAWNEWQSDCGSPGMVTLIRIESKGQVHIRRWTSLTFCGASIPMDLRS